MITLIPIVTQETLQSTLNATFGAGIFEVKVDKNVSPKQCYLEYADNTQQSLIDQAIVLSNENAADVLQTAQLRLYQSLITVANNTIAAKEKPPFTETDVQEATLWLQDQTLPCPGCVLFLSVRDGITTQEAAQYVIDSQTIYQTFIDQVNSIKVNGQNELMNATDIFSCKNIAQTSMDQMKNLL